MQLDSRSRSPEADLPPTVTGYEVLLRGKTPIQNRQVVQEDFDGLV